MRSTAGTSTALPLVLVLAACPRPGGSAAPVATDRVDLPPSYKFMPAAITVPAGTPVTWTNHDHFTHSVRLLDDGGRVMIVPRDSNVRFSFATPGLHRYDCSFHPRDMAGTVLVTVAR